MTGAKHGLMSAVDLLGLLAGASVPVVLDVRSGPDGAGRALFEAGHIPGARHSDYAADGWRQRRNGAPGMLPDADHLAVLFGRLGLARDIPIVIAPAGQSANDLAAAARIFWTLRHCGYAPLAILDGGMSGWIAEGHALEHGPARTFDGGPAPIVFQPGLRANAEATMQAVGSRTTLLDGRGPGYFRGEEKAPEARAAGHIPGALNIDYVLAYDAGRNRLKPREELAALYAGIPQESGVISYCNTGHTAALNWFALSEVLGYPDIRLYDGSMTEWTQEASRPVAR